MRKPDGADQATVDDDRVPPGVDPNRASIARVYDYMVGGKDNFAVDREAADMALKLAPDAREVALGNRAFLRRAVRYLVAEAGIRQFLDIGSGLPTRGNVHEIAHEVDPNARVVYVDNDPMVLAHGRALLADNRTTTVVASDLRRPAEILADPDVRAVLDLRRPVGLLLNAILHHINDHEDPGAIAAQLRTALPSGSYLVISHFHNPGAEFPEIATDVARAEAIFNATMGTGRWRSRAEIRSYFGDFELVEPGLLPAYDWRSDRTGPLELLETTYRTLLAGVARKP